MFRSLIAGAGILFAAAGGQAASLTEESCSILASKEGEKPALRDAPGLSVLSLRPDSPLVIQAADGVKVNALVCWRSEARFSENDYLAIDAGFPLYVKADFDDESLNRTLVLERSGGAFRARLVDGPALSVAEEDEIKRFLNLYTARMQERSPTPVDAKPGSVAPLSSNAPPDRPHPVTTEDLQAYENAIAPHVAQAKRTWPDARRRYLAGLPAGQIFFVTTRLRDARGRHETVFIRVQSIKDGLISGTIATQLQIFRAYKPGDAYSLREEDLMDWMIARPDGSEEGNVVGKFLDTYRP
jgi:hypothetical protein